jgi:methylated-DNA-[protein]-cysteine S-methyltransferase
MEATMHGTLTLWSDRVETPIGELTIVGDADGRMRALDWTEYGARLEARLRRHYGATGFTLSDPPPREQRLSGALRAYFAGALDAIDDLAVETGGTPFQRAVWAALREIPCGHTMSYAAIARRIGRPAAVRAVGLANNANPIGIVVPCHRVIGADGSLTGYGGGLGRKRWLLAHERGERPLPFDAPR